MCIRPSPVYSMSQLLSKLEQSSIAFSSTFKLMRSSVYTSRSKGILIHFRHFKLKD